MKGGARPWDMIGLKVETGELFICLNDFNYDYFEQYIKDKLDDYINGFSIKIESLLKKYLQAINEASG